MNKKLTLILRIILGLLLVVFGANHLYSFMPAMQFPKPAGDFMMALNATGYFFKFVGITLVITGLLLLTNKWVPFALVVLAPFSVNVILFHLALAPAAIGPAVVVTLLNILLIYANWEKFKPLFE